MLPSGLTIRVALSNQCKQTCCRCRSQPASQCAECSSNFELCCGCGSSCSLSVPPHAPHQTRVNKSTKWCSPRSPLQNFSPHFPKKKKRPLAHEMIRKNSQPEGTRSIHRAGWGGTGRRSTKDHHLGTYLLLLLLLQPGGLSGIWGRYASCKKEDDLPLLGALVDFTDWAKGSTKLQWLVIQKIDEGSLKCS